MLDDTRELDDIVEDVITIDDIPRLNEELEGAGPHDIIKFAHGLFGDSLTMACSFQDLVMLDILAKAAPGVRVFTLDTGYLFHETEETIRRARHHYPELRIDVFRPKLELGEHVVAYGPRLYEADPELCCELRKMEPMREALSGYSAWMTGIRRDQSASRANTKPVAWDIKWGMAKFAPMHSWTAEDVWTYANLHEVPYNRLHDRGYPSIGCAPCTSVPAEDDPRSGRWAGSNKTECGLHVDTTVGVPGRVERLA